MRESVKYNATRLLEANVPVCEFDDQLDTGWNVAESHFVWNNRHELWLAITETECQVLNRCRCITVTPRDAYEWTQAELTESHQPLAVGHAVADD